MNGELKTEPYLWQFIASEGLVLSRRQSTADLTWLAELLNKSLNL